MVNLPIRCYLPRLVTVRNEEQLRRLEFDRPNRMFLVSTDDQEGSLIRYVFFFCPCGCGQRVCITCEPYKFDKRWYVDCVWPSSTNHPGVVSIRPGIHMPMRTTCGSRFKIENNSVRWEGDL